MRWSLNYEDGDRGVPGVFQPPNVHLEATAVVVDGVAPAKDHIDQRALRVVGLDAGGSDPLLISEAASARTKCAQQAAVDLLDAGLGRGAIRVAEDGVLDQQADGRDDRLLAATVGVRRPRGELAGATVAVLTIPWRWLFSRLTLRTTTCGSAASGQDQAGGSGKSAALAFRVRVAAVPSSRPPVMIPSPPVHSIFNPVTVMSTPHQMLSLQTHSAIESG